MGVRSGAIHVAITPMRNEVANIEKMSESMISQTFRPKKWIIIDDGSNDGSSEIVRSLAEKNDWIEYATNDEEGVRKRGKKLARIFNLGLSMCGNEWSYCSKIDADMVLPSNYFKDIIGKFEEDESLGIGSGVCEVRTKLGRRLERTTKGHTRGGLKTYRRACYDEIGGIREVDGWDGIDNSVAQMKGWLTGSFSDIVVDHLRVTGGQHGQIKSQYEAGRFAYSMGYYWPYMMARTMVQVFKWPYFLGGASMLFGFFSGYISRGEKFGEEEVVLYIREMQKSRISGFLGFGKR